MSVTTEVTEFENGVRLVTEPMSGCLSASIGIWVGRGARHESFDQNGIAHFLEHMAFKGTQKRSALNIAEEIENVGGYLNAYTSKESTAYYSRVLGSDVELAFDVLSDILLNPSFDQNEVEVERGVILQEIGQTLDTPDDIIFDWLSEASFPDQALGRPILGSRERVSAFQPSDFRKFIAENYGGDQLVISAAGAVDHDQLAQQVSRVFSDLKYKSEPFHEAPVFCSGQKCVEKELQQAHIALAFEAPCHASEDYYSAQLLSSILGGGMSSRLNQSIREKLGLCYTIFSSYQPLSDIGQLYVYSGTSGDGIEALMNQLTEEFKRFADSLDANELERAKAQIRAGSVMALEAVSTRVQRNANQLLAFEKIRSIEEILDEINEIKIENVRALAARIFATDPQMVLYGQIQSAPDFHEFVARMRE